MSEANTETNPLELSDEDFAKLNAPDAPASGEAVVEEAQVTEGNDDVPAVQEAAPDQEAGGAAEEASAIEAEKEEAKPEGEAEAASVVDDTAKEPEAKVEPEKVVEPVGSKTEAKSYTPPADDVAQGFYKQILGTPIRANGKDIQLKSPEEAVQLMQMGANYTRKLQELAPHRKLVLTLQNAGIDESKLNFLIDLDKGNPDAVKKLIKDSGIDPLEIDTSADLNYSAGNHTASDQEVDFRTVLTEVSEKPAGNETLLIIDKYDDASKNALWESPKLIESLHQQRELGIYDLITTEMDRQITLGSIPPNTPFLEAYKIAGDSLMADPNLAGQSTKTPVQPAKAAPVVVETRVAAPKATVQADDKASAASMTTSTKAVKEAPKNPFAMSDEEFLKEMDGRL